MSATDHDLESHTRLRAYHLWDEAGRPDGRDEEFWVQAQLLEKAELASKDSFPASDPPANTGIVGPRS